MFLIEDDEDSILNRLIIEEFIGGKNTRLNEHAGGRLKPFLDVQKIFFSGPLLRESIRLHRSGHGRLAVVGDDGGETVAVIIVIGCFYITGTEEVTFTIWT